MMLDRGTFLVPTLSAPRGVFAARDAGIPVPDVFIKKCEMVIEVHTESIRRAIEAGVRSRWAPTQVFVLTVKTSASSR